MAQESVPWDGSGAQPSRRWRRPLLVGVLAAAVILVTTTSLSFLSSNGTAGATVTPSGSGSANVYAAASTSPTLPSTSLTWQVTGTTTDQLPAWNVSQGQVAQVTTAGDVAVVDGTAGKTLITITLANAAAMAGAYSYVNIPIDIYQCTVATSTCTWAAADELNTSPAVAYGTQYLSFSNASLNFEVSGGTGTYYEITVPTGGSLYCYNTATTSDLSPSFLVTTQLL